MTSIQSSTCECWSQCQATITSPPVLFDFFLSSKLQNLEVEIIIAVLFDFCDFFLCFRLPNSGVARSDDIHRIVTIFQIWSPQVKVDKSQTWRGDRNADKVKKINWITKHFPPQRIVKVKTKFLNKSHLDQLAGLFKVGVTHVSLFHGISSKTILTENQFNPDNLSNGCLRTKVKHVALIRPGSIVFKWSTEVIMWAGWGNPKQLRQSQNQEQKALPEKEWGHIEPGPTKVHTCLNDHSQTFFCNPLPPFSPPRCSQPLSLVALKRDGWVGGGYNQRSCGKVTGHYPAHHDNRRPKHTLKSWQKATAYTNKYKNTNTNKETGYYTALHSKKQPRQTFKSAAERLRKWQQ